MDLRPTERPSDNLEQAFDRPLAMGRGSGATLELRTRPRICTPHKSQDLGSISYPSKASGATPGGCARTNPPKKSNTKASRGPGDDLARSPSKSKPDVQPLKEYPYSSIVSRLLSGTTIRGTQIMMENHPASPFKGKN
jgi:hypothetical protein